MATKDETQAWLDNGGSRLGMQYGITSTMDGDNYWFTNFQGEGHENPPGLFYAGCCHVGNRFFVCVKTAGKILDTLSILMRIVNNNIW